MRNAKQGLAELSRPGPLAVLRGDLGMSGIPGVIYAPEEGLGLPAVAFGHDWLQPPTRYADLQPMVNATTSCTLLTQSDPMNVTVTVTKVSGGLIRYSIKRA